jgi:beta-lactamase superfamily II metal-dependent hydrolase
MRFLSTLDFRRDAHCLGRMFPARHHPAALLCAALVFVFSGLLPALSGATGAVPGLPLPAWERGMLDIHQINTGTGDAALFILPDGTTFLLDAGAVNRTGSREPNYDAPQRPDTSRRPGQTIAGYVRRVHPAGADGVLDYAALTHFHGDHMGTLMPDSPQSASGAYKLTGITDVGEELTIRTLLDRDWPDYDFPAPSGGAMMANYRAFLKWQVENRGLKVERFEPGRADQIALRHAARDFPEFEIRNIAANGYVWTGSGTEARNRYPKGIVPVENNCSLAFRLTYGAFTYFNGGDMAGFLSANAPAWGEMESAVAWVTGPVDAYALNHHGTNDSANAYFLSVLQPRIHILSTYASSQPSPGVMRRMTSERIYPGPRDIFITNSHWQGRREHMVKLFGEAETVWLLEQIDRTAANQGHVLVRVEPGGARYQVIVIDDRDDSGNVRSVHGPYDGRGAAAVR